MNQNNNIEQIATQWHVRNQEGLDVKEQKEFELWIETKEHRTAYEKIDHLIEECLALDEQFINALDEEIMRDDAILHTSLNKTLYNNRSFWASFAAACLVLFFGYAFKHYYFEPTFSQNYNTLNQKMLNIVLPDETRIDLDIKSGFDVAYYNHKRTVVFNEGKAVFEVTKDTRKPFVIHVGEATIEVVGTKFEVLHVNDFTTVNVLEGIVNVNDKTKSAFYQLKKSQSITFNEMGKMIHYGHINPQKIATWKKNELFFDATTLRDAALQFAYYTNQSIAFESDDIALLKLSGNFSTTHFQGFIEAIETIYGLKAKKDQEGIKIVKK